MVLRLHTRPTLRPECARDLKPLRARSMLFANKMKNGEGSGW